MWHIIFVNVSVEGIKKKKKKVVPPVAFSIE